MPVVPRVRGENLRSIYVLLFLTVAFFFLEYQDPQRYFALVHFDRQAFLSGEVWRVITYQFTVSGQGLLSFPRPVALFFTMLILYIMGAAVEEEWGTRAFLTLFLLSTVTSAAVAAWFGIALLGSYFVNFSLLFVYASLFPEQTFFVFGVLPIRVRWLATIAALFLVAGVFLGGPGAPANTAALGGSIVSYAYYRLLRSPRTKVVKEKPREDVRSPLQTAAIRNAARFVGMKKLLAAGVDADIDHLIAQCETEVVAGVNICPPADYKPEHIDGYCIRCEGFAECSARYLRLNRTPASS